MAVNTDYLKIERLEPETCYALRPFDTMVLSFCADTPPGASVEVQARVRLEDGAWTQWFSWGLWSPFIDRHSVNSADEFATMDTDTLKIKGGKRACAVQIRALTVPNAFGQAPAVRSVHLAVKDSAQPCEEPLRARRDACVTAPSYSQMVRDPRIGGVICSATTIAMLLAQKGERVLPEEIALHNYDSAYKGCGNWSFSTACAAAWGYEAYVRYATLEDVLMELEDGNAVGASVSYTKDPDRSDLPYLENAPCNTPGHLLVICGFETAPDGRQFVIAHDPAARSNAEVERRYPVEQFLRAWSNRLIYVVHGPRAVSARWIPTHVAAYLSPAGEDTYALIANEKPVPLAPDGDFRNTVACWITARKGDADADCDFAYGEITPEGLVHLPGYAGQKLYLIANRGTVYEVNA